MSYATMMVNLELGGSNARLLAVAGSLAARWQARVVGIAARRPMPIIYSDGCYIPAEIIQDQRDAIESELRTAEAEFHHLLGPHARHREWRAATSIDTPSHYVAAQARSADLVLTSMPSRGRADRTRVVASELVMQCGRPVLVVPATVPSPSAALGLTRPELALEHALLAWKDTRETRRAALDALPLLQRATRVSIVEICPEEDIADARLRLADVAAWLLGHGIRAETLAQAAAADDAQQLGTFAQDRGVDLIVAGAYGHSRLQEWALGGVTRDLLLRGDRCAMLSH